MVQYFLALGLLLLTLLTVSLQRTYYFFPVRELKRQARAGDRDARVLYRAVAYGGSLRLLLWLIIGLTVSASFILLIDFAPAWSVFIALAGLIWYAFGWSPNSPVTRFGARIALTLSPAVSWILYYTHRYFDWVVRHIEHRRPLVFHTGLFERKDLIELIKDQRAVRDSRIPDGELELVLHALSFGEKKVTSTMVPREDVESVKENDVLGPILMDELYDSQHSRFPVLSENGKSLVGTLFLRDLIAAKHGGIIRDVMNPHLAYIHEDQTLYQVLHAYLTTKHQLFVVIDSEEEYVGIITMDDVIEQIIGHKIEEDFDGYEDKVAVAASREPMKLVPAADTVDDIETVDVPEPA
jgi:putative hemolysin